MSYIVDFSETVSVETGVVSSFPPIKNENTSGNKDVILIIGYRTGDSTSWGLTDDTGWTEITGFNHSVTQLSQKAWWKYSDSSNMAIPGVTGTSGINAVAMSIRGVDQTNPIDDVDKTYAVTNSPVCPSVTTTQDNQIIIRHACKDAATIYPPTGKQIIFRKTVMNDTFEMKDTGATGTLALPTSSTSDQTITGTIAIKRLATDTSTPLVISPVAGAMIQIEPDADNTDAFRDAIRTAGTQVLDRDGTIRTWTFDLATVNPTTDVVTLDASANGDTGRNVYITGASAIGIPDGYYFFTTDTNNPGFRQDAESYGEATPVDITGTSTGTATITDVGIIVRDYDDADTTNMDYPTEGTTGPYFNNNFCGNARSYTTPEDMTGKIIAGYWKASSTSHTKAAYFLAIDDSNNWKIWRLSIPGQIPSTPSYFQIQLDGDTEERSVGTFDITDVKYYAILFTNRSSSNRFGMSTYQQQFIQNMVITGGNADVGIKMYQIKKWLAQQEWFANVKFEEYIKNLVDSQSVLNYSLTLGDGSNTTYIDFENESLAYPTLADNASFFSIHINPDVLGWTINKCAGNWLNEQITADQGSFFTSTALDTIDYSGTSFLFQNLTLQDGKTYSNCNYINCKQIIRNAASLDTVTIDGSSDADGALLYDTTESGTLTDVTFKNNEYAIEISGVTDFAMSGCKFENSGTKDLNVTAVAGTLNITIDAGDDVPTYDTAGATVNIIAPPNEQDFKVDGVVSGDRVAVFKTSGGVVEKDQYTSHATNNVAGDSTIEIQEAIPSDTPDDGIFIMVAVDEGEEHVYRYNSWTGSIFTLPTAITGTGDATGSGSSTTQLTDDGVDFVAGDLEVGDIIYDSTNGEYAYVVSIDSSTQITTTEKATTWLAASFETNSLVQTYDGSDTAFVPYIFEEATGTSITVTVIYDSDRTVMCRVRKQSILPFETTGSFTSTGYTVTAIRTTDDIYTVDATSNIDVNFEDSVVYVTSSKTDATVQEFVNAIRNAEDELRNITYNKVIDAAGKADLGGGVSTAITMTLNDTWYIEFYSGVVLGTVSGGNIVGGDSDYPIRADVGSGDTVLQLSAEAATIVATGSGVTEQDKLDIADRVWDEGTSGHVSSATFGEKVGKKLLSTSKFLGLK